MILLGPHAQRAEAVRYLIDPNDRIGYREMMAQGPLATCEVWGWLGRRVGLIITVLVHRIPSHIASVTLNRFRSQVKSGQERATRFARKSDTSRRDLPKSCRAHTQAGEVGTSPRQQLAGSLRRWARFSADGALLCFICVGPSWLTL